MKKIILTFILVFSFIGLVLSDPFLDQFDQLNVPEIKMPEISKEVLPNGLKFYYLPNQELPVFEMQALIEVGSIDESVEKKGLAAVMMELLRTGGSLHTSSKEIDQTLEQYAMMVSSETHAEFSVFKIRSLAKDAPLAIKLFFELFTEPAFDEARLNTIKQAMTDEILRRNETPSDVAGREYRQVLFGNESVWARLPGLKTTSQITRDDVVQFYKNYVGPQKIWLAVSSQISKAQILKTISEYSFSWKNSTIDRTKPAPVVKEWKPGLYVVPQKNTQSALTLGHFGDTRQNPDKYALILANYILGGTTFGGRLGSRIRVELGLAYGAYSAYALTTDVGAFEMNISTQSQTTAQALSEAQSVFKNLVTQNYPTDREILDAKKAILTRLIFELSDPFEIVESQVYYDYYGYPPNYLSVYQKKMLAVGKGDIERVLQNYFFPDRLVMVVVGDPEKMGDLSKIGGAIHTLPLDLD
ncbi:MAG: hypothetical protein A3G32_00595 [Deltaproteobacteria bacterium RIFCSPLOWO2_12_FULL_40_28]|nr:MAG: hypothetical protein A3C45_10330 [Deltaproteobacteria bacterium RIFCSPHIGHO2_02_FULL_40_28]OGQ20188.1 MAG: hypothetical protein A3E27_01115 [Deltaproteobacteria bacterium RIFCSPHIGHO2_12_FULL_40_32]OGQ40179.1 MAG: hypothetical protein A3I69_09065 [Deltaproteobacteria bacterium RIFCSPLOWO2_02_FULL_40_36]OGQ54743.1 MAG: hypothetical protein A3G32_00595 [Deltaproteobacteria bacterium RIFCSPLOWO2_12_FULL_40_28]